MAIKIGRQLYLGAKKEGTRLTAETSADTWLPVESNTLQKQYEYMEDNNAYNLRDSLLGQEIESFHVAGDISALLDADTAGFYFKHFFGDVSSAQEATSGAYKHTFTVADDTQLDTFTAFYDHPNIGELKANGCTISQLEIAGAVNDKVTITANVLGLGEVSADSQTPSYSKPTRYMQPRFAKINYADTIAGLSSPTNLDVRDFTLTLANNSELDPAIGSVNPVDVHAQNFTGTLAFNAVLKASDFETLRTAGTKKAWELVIENTSASELGTSSGLQPMVRVRIAPSTLRINYTKENDGTVKFGAEVMAEYSTTDSFTVQGYIQNETTSY